MKKIINGKKYDTETAELMLEGPMNAEYSRAVYRKAGGELFTVHYRPDDFVCLTEALLESGAYFNTLTETEGNVALKEEHLKSWLEQTATVEQYEAIFGEVGE